MSLLVQVLIAGHGSNIQPGTLKAAVDEVAPLVNDTDLLIAALSLTFCTTLLQRQPQQSGLVTDRVLPAAMTLSKSPLLQVPLTISQSVEPQQACNDRLAMPSVMPLPAETMFDRTVPICSSSDSLFVPSLTTRKRMSATTVILSFCHP